MEQTLQDADLAPASLVNFRCSDPDISAHLQGGSYIRGELLQHAVPLDHAQNAAVPKGSGGLRVRFHIIRNARIELVGKYQSCMVSK